MDRGFLNSKFGIEIEMTGITRSHAAHLVRLYLGGTVERTYGTYDTYKVTAPDGRVWEIKYDSSINQQRKVGGQKVAADREHSIELVSPVLTYDSDIDTVQGLVRVLRKGGAFSEAQNATGIHIHLDGAKHNARTIRNFVHLVHAKNDLLYESLQIEAARMFFCKKMDEVMVNRIKNTTSPTMERLEEIWYEGNSGRRSSHYNSTRYRFLNLHSYFNGTYGTVELRAFNGTLHAGKVRSYIVLALAMNHKALTQKSVSSKKAQLENPKFAMRTWLTQMGLVGEEFKACREHLTSHLAGSSAWRHQLAG